MIGCEQGFLAASLKCLKSDLKAKSVLAPVKGYCYRVDAHGPKLASGLKEYLFKSYKPYTLMHVCETMSVRTIVGQQALNSAYQNVQQVSSVLLTQIKTIVIILRYQKSNPLLEKRAQRRPLFDPKECNIRDLFLLLTR